MTSVAQSVPEPCSLFSTRPHVLAHPSLSVMGARPRGRLERGLAPTRRRAGGRGWTQRTGRPPGEEVRRAQGRAALGTPAASPSGEKAGSFASSGASRPRFRPVRFRAAAEGSAEAGGGEAGGGEAAVFAAAMLPAAPGGPGASRARSPCGPAPPGGWSRVWGGGGPQGRRGGREEGGSRYTAAARRRAGPGTFQSTGTGVTGFSGRLGTNVQATRLREAVRKPAASVSARRRRLAHAPESPPARRSARALNRSKGLRSVVPVLWEAFLNFIMVIKSV